MVRWNRKVASGLRGSCICLGAVRAPYRANKLKCFRETSMPLFVVGFCETKKTKLLGGTTTAESHGYPTFGQYIRDCYLFCDIEWMVQVETDDCRAQADVMGLTGHVQRKKQRSGQMPAVRMAVMLGKPRILHAKLIG